jgi:hypothetical protein
MDENCELTSAVALDRGWEFSRPCSLVHHDKSSVAELDHAVVSPANRKRNLLKRMTAFLEDEALTKSLQGIYVEAVTSHTFTQRGIEKFGYRECALYLGLLPCSIRFKKIGDSLSQRESCVVYYKTLGTPLGSVIYAPEQHVEILRQIYLNLGISVHFLNDTAPEGQGELKASYNSSLGFGDINVLKVGGERRTEIKRGLLDLIEIAGPRGLSGSAAGPVRNSKAMRSCRGRGFLLQRPGTQIRYRWRWRCPHPPVFKRGV